MSYEIKYNNTFFGDGLLFFMKQRHRRRSVILNIFMAAICSNFQRVVTFGKFPNLAKV